MNEHKVHPRGNEPDSAPFWAEGDSDRVFARCLELLGRFGAFETRHSGRTLFQHLYGTYLLLKSWRSPPDLCLAGLFHSIYGTDSFRHRSADFESRMELRQTIGPMAESLVYSFCVIPRQTLISQAPHGRLILLGVANTLEQIPHQLGCVPLPRIQHLLERYSVWAHLLPPRARAALKSAQESVGIRRTTP